MLALLIGPTLRRRPVFILNVELLLRLFRNYCRKVKSIDQRDRTAGFRAVGRLWVAGEARVMMAIPPHVTTQKVGYNA